MWVESQLCYSPLKKALNGLEWCLFTCKLGSYLTFKDVVKIKFDNKHPRLLAQSKLHSVSVFLSCLPSLLHPPFPPSANF